MTEENNKKVTTLLRKLYWYENKADLFFGETDRERLSLCKTYATASSLVSDLIMIPMNEVINELEWFVKNGKCEISQVFLDGFYHWLDLYFRRWDKSYPFIREADESCLYGIYMEEDDLFQLLREITVHYIYEHNHVENKELKEHLDKLEELIKNPQVVKPKVNNIDRLNDQLYGKKKIDD
jgi:hypothetical protein